MIFYFSGTGNSQRVAKQIAETIGDEIVSINQSLKKGTKDTYQSKRPLVFVAPTYAWRMPKVVEQWIRETRFEGSCDAYFVLTCDSSCGNAAAYTKKICMEKGMNFYGLRLVAMPENYVALFATPDKSECQTILERAKQHVTFLADQIQKKEHFSEGRKLFREKLQSGPVNFLFYTFFVHDKGFTVSDNCISCNKCVQRCPLNNIKITNQKPIWQGNCTHCMACIAGCPTEAIEYKRTSKGKHRHYIMEE